MEGTSLSSTASPASSEWYIGKKLIIESIAGIE